MSSPFDALAAVTLSPLCDQHFGETVSITRGTVTTTGVTASWSTQGAEVVSPDGQHTAIVDRLWIVAKTRYIVSGSAVEPRAGDRLTDADSQQWEVLPASVAPPAVSFAGGHEWKIATRRVT